MSIAKARDRLGWRSTPLSDWLATTAQAFLKDRPVPPVNDATRQHELNLLEAWQSEGGAVLARESP